MDPRLLMTQRNGQDLVLGLGRSAGAAAVALEGLLQTDGMLMDLCILSTQQGLVTDIKVSGQSLMCSDQGVDIRGFDPQAIMEGHRTVGIPLASALPFRVEATLAAAGTATARIGVDPCPQELIQPINQLPPAMLSYVFGLGSVVVAAGGDAIITATARRYCKLGRLFLSASATPEDITIRGVLINQVQMLAGRNAPASAVDELGVGEFDPFASDNDGLILGKTIRPSEIVNINLHNYNAAPVTVRGGIFCIPEGR